MIELGPHLPTLHGTRVRLRELTADDAPALFEIFSDPEVLRYWSSPALVDMAGADTLLTQIQTFAKDRTLFQWGITRAEADVVIGTATLFRIDLHHQRAEIGYALARSV